MSEGENRLTNEILAVMWRYSQESDVTILETIHAAHSAAERIFQISLDAKQSEDQF
jgi:hypothetical protein